MSTTPAAPRWMSLTLRLAALYNVLWGALTVLYPAWLFDLTGLEPPAYPFIWQCVGMIVGVYGVGYWVAARDPLRHWPIVLVGFLGKIFGPLGYVDGVVRGNVPVEFGVTLPTNDLIWWIPFAMMLWAAFRAAGGHGTDQSVRSPADAMRSAVNPSGVSLFDLSAGRDCLVVFLRHAGCTFCREALADLSARKGELSEAGVQLVLVHMDPDIEAAGKLFARYDLSHAEQISDPGRGLYRAFDLERGSFAELFGLKVWLRGAAATLRGHMVGKLVGDGFQMPGAFVVRDGGIVRAYRHRTAADRPDYAGLACG
ncbi:MAG: peroxiredoxin-like family protein [Planctomycetota bacterium]